MPADQPFRSRIDIAKQMLRALKARLNERFVVVTDALYAKRKLLREASRLGVVIISRLRSDAALYKEPQPSKGRGRPRFYGEKLPPLPDMARDLQGYQHHKLCCFMARCKPSSLRRLMPCGSLRQQR